MRIWWINFCIFWTAVKYKSSLFIMSFHRLSFEYFFLRPKQIHILIQYFFLDWLILSHFFSPFTFIWFLFFKPFIFRNNCTFLNIFIFRLASIFLSIQNLPLSQLIPQISISDPLQPHPRPEETIAEQNSNKSLYRIWSTFL